MLLVFSETSKEERAPFGNLTHRFENNIKIARFEVVSRRCWRFQVFWHITLCRSLNRGRRFHGSSCLLFHAQALVFLIPKMKAIGSFETYQSAWSKHFISLGVFNLKALRTSNLTSFWMKFPNNARYVIYTSE